jgi:hypothetical protein
MAIFTVVRPSRNSSQISKSRFRLEALRTPPLSPQKLRRQLGFFGHPGWREQIGIAEHVVALAEVLHFYQVLFHQGLEAEMGRTKPHAQVLGQCTLTDLERLVQTAQGFELDFFLETSQFLKWGYEAQGDLVTLPPCRFTISKRGQRVLTGGLEQ